MKGAVSAMGTLTRSGAEETSGKGAVWSGGGLRLDVGKQETAVEPTTIEIKPRQSSEKKV
jgi:hypothetical protein